MTLIILKKIYKTNKNIKQEKEFIHMIISLDKFEEKKLPPIEKFYSQLNIIIMIMF